jgi:hypothetical protein
MKSLSKIAVTVTAASILCTLLSVGFMTGPYVAKSTTTEWADCPLDEAKRLAHKHIPRLGNHETDLESVFLVSLLVSLGLANCGKTWRDLASRVSHISLKLRTLAIAGLSGLNRQNGLKGRCSTTELRP